MKLIDVRVLWNSNFNPLYSTSTAAIKPYVGQHTARPSQTITMERFHVGHEFLRHSTRERDGYDRIKGR